MRARELSLLTVHGNVRDSSVWGVWGVGVVCRERERERWCFLCFFGRREPPPAPAAEESRSRFDFFDFFEGFAESIAVRRFSINEK